MEPALVVFHGRGRGWIGRRLRPGFRHCFVAVLAGDYWITLDGRAGIPALAVVAGADFDLAGFYRGQGYTVVETVRRGRAPLQPLMLSTCVGASKRVLGLSAAGVLTPWRLYRHLLGAPT